MGELFQQETRLLNGATNMPHILETMIFAATENGGLTMANEVRLIDANAAEKEVADLIELEYGYEGIREDVANIFAELLTIDPESLRAKGRWEIHCRTTYDSWTQETDEEFYLECSECKRQVWDVDYMAVQNDDRQKLIEKYPYCHCGCKMEG